jgi:hypothetical protein
MTRNRSHMKSILDHSFRYTSSAETDLKKTFARIRKEQRLRERNRPRTDVVPRLLSICIPIRAISR